MEEIEMKRLLIVLATVSTAGFVQAEYYVHPETKKIRALQKDIADAKAKRNKILKESYGADAQSMSADLDAEIEKAAMKQAATKEETKKEPTGRSREEIIKAVKNNETVSDDEVLSVMEKPTSVPENLKSDFSLLTQSLPKDRGDINWYKNDCIKNDRLKIFKNKSNGNITCFSDQEINTYEQTF